MSARVARAAPPGFYDPARGFVNPDLDPTTAAANGVNGAPARISLSFPVTVRRGVKRVTRYVTRRTINDRGQPLVRASLTTLEGAPIAAARVWLATAERDRPWQLSGPFVTTGDGIADIRLPAGAPRRLRLVYFPQANTNGHAESPSISLRVRVPVSLHRSRKTVPPRGRVTLTAHIRRDVFTDQQTIIGTLQVLQRGRWTTFRSARFPATTGRWSTALRFDRSRPGTRFRFRIRIPTQPAMRYSTGTSTVRVITLRTRS